MTILRSSDQCSQELNLKQFEIRKAAKLCICFVCFIQILYRLVVILWDSSLTPKSVLMLQISLPFCALMIIIIAIEYILFKKKGPVVANYSNLVDLVLLITFVADWIFFILAIIYKMELMTQPYIIIPALFGFTAFSWRTLLVTLLLQKWQLKIIAPIFVTFFITAYAVFFCKGNLVFLLTRTAMQLFNMILIVYCQDKVALKLMRTNLEQEKWMQVNNFIFDNIPENIMILDLNGEAKFMSKHCKVFMKKYNFTANVKGFFKKVQNLQNQQFKFDPLGINTPTTIDKMTTCNELYFDLIESEANLLKAGTLQNLITNFSNFIKSKNLQERQFLVYNGKFKAETHSPEKSLEMKISFVQHYQNDYIILIFRDTTKRDLLVKLEETNNYKDQLLASVSHELRAPLNGNINLVEGAIFSSASLENIKENFLVPALRSSKFLLHIINDILDMSQIKQKKLRLVFQPEDLKETLKNTAQLVEIQARKKGLDFGLEIDPKISNSFCTDHLRVSQIVLNLLTNALKYTNHGTIKLIAASINNSSSVKISIEDTGIGISQENIRKLFSHDHIILCEEKDKLNPTGAGLGLNIASNLVELLAPDHQKKINVTSVLNKGSSFTFILENKPCARKSVDTSFETTEEMTFVPQLKVFDEKIQTLTRLYSGSSKIETFDSEHHIATCSCPKVLIVDDNPFNTMALETVLRSLQVKSDSAYNGPSGLQKLLDRETTPCGDNCKPYSVVFMDQEMPGMSGNETVREIKKLQEKNQVAAKMRIIGCTAHKGKEEVERFLASGLEDCIFKPVSIGIIRDVLKEEILN